MDDISVDRPCLTPIEPPDALYAFLAVWHHGVAIVDGDGGIIFANSPWCRFAHRYDDGPNARGDTVILLDETFPATAPTPCNRERVDGLKGVMAGLRDHFACELLLPTEGEAHGYRVDAHRFDRPPAKAIVSVSEIPSRQRAEQAWRTNPDQIYQAQKMEILGTLVAGMAHEINNPTSLLRFNLPIVQRIWADVLSLLKDGPAKGQSRQFGGYDWDFVVNQSQQLLADMDMAASRISKIVRDLRHFSRRTPIGDQEAVDINVVVHAAVRLAQTTIRKFGVKLGLELGEDLPSIRGNSTSIEQVVLNLIINAIQSIDHDQGQIDIRSGVNQGRSHVFIDVHDNGGGIAPELADKIFDPFVTAKQAQGGTGLGLAVSYNLVKAHDGHMAFKSSPEGGTVFTLTLPTEPQWRRPRVLVVDDDAMVRQLMVASIRKSGRYHVDEAANGVDGLIKMGAQPPDLLILDLLMPGMNGLEVCQAIANRAPFATMKVLITTGYPRHPDLRQIRSLGFTNIYAKPISVTDLQQAITTILG